MKKIAILLIILSILIIACGKKEVTNSEVTEILFWQAMGGPLGDALEELVQKFNDTHPDINVTSVNMGNYTALSQKLMASIQTGNQPDVAQAYEAWIANMIEGDVIVPIEEFIKEDPNFGAKEMEDIYPVFINSVHIKGIDLDDLLSCFHSLFIVFRPAKQAGFPNTTSPKHAMP